MEQATKEVRKSRAKNNSGNSKKMKSNGIDDNDDGEDTVMMR